MAEGFQNGRTTRVSRVIRAGRHDVYQAWLDPGSLASWLPPDGMRGDVHHFDARVGGTYRMSLVYESSAHAAPGKSSDDTDTVQGRFVELIPDERIVQAVDFESDKPEFAGEMTLTVTLADAPDGTDVTVLCENIPSGVRLEDNEAGSRSSLRNLAAFFE